MNSSAAAVVVATSDRAATGEFLETFGFLRGDRGYFVPQGAPVRVELVDAETPGRAPRDFERGPRALDIYTSDIRRAVDAISRSGWEVSPVGTVSLGPVTMHQALVTGPEGLPIVLVESSHRRASLLDHEPDRLFSEPHSVVWCVDDRDAEAARWEAAGFSKGMDLAFEEPAVSDYLGLPRSPVPILMTMLSDEAVSPIRLELLEFPEDAGDRPADPTSGGIRGLAFEVTDPDETSAKLGLEAPIASTAGGIFVEFRPIRP